MGIHSNVRLVRGSMGYNFLLAIKRIKLALEKNKYYAEMKKPITWGNFIAVFSILTPFMILFVSWVSGVSKNVAKQGVKIENIEVKMYDSNLEMRKSFDNVNEKLDKIMYKQEYRK